MPTKEEIMAQIQIFKNAKDSLVQDSLIKILEMLCENIATEETTDQFDFTTWRLYGWFF